MALDLGFFYRHHDPFMLLFLFQGVVLLVCSAHFGKHPYGVR